MIIWNARTRRIARQVLAVGEQCEDRIEGSCRSYQVEEILHQLMAMFGRDAFRMELHAVDVAFYAPGP